MMLLCVVVKFSEATNQPPVARQSDLQNVIEISSVLLNQSLAVGVWNDSLTLIILLRNLPVTEMREELLGELHEGMTLTFKHQRGTWKDITV